LGCHWFTPEVSSIPKVTELKLPKIHETVNPPLEFREPFVKECFDGDWSARNRCNGTTATLTEKHGGKIIYNGFVHTFDGLVPPRSISTNTRSTSRWSAASASRSAPSSAARTRTSSDRDRGHHETHRGDARGDRLLGVAERLVLLLRVRHLPGDCESRGLADWPRAADGEQVAKAVAAKHPDKLIDTLAYQWTRKPPKKMRPEPNVIVRLCSIECCFTHSFHQMRQPEMNKEFVKDVEGWSKISNRLWVWDYTTTFASYLTPFPNLRVRADNIRSSWTTSVTGIFEQDVYNTHRRRDERPERLPRREAALGPEVRRGKGH
jgi:hypothetical protein